MPRLRLVATALLGGLGIHVALLACGSADHASMPADNGGGDPIADGMADALATLEGSVPEARADDANTCTCAAPKTSTFVEPCNKTLPYIGGGGTYYYAEHVFPGASKAQLMSVRTYFTSASTYSNMPAGYDGQASEHIWVGADRVAGTCFTASDTLTFVAPF